MAISNVPHHSVLFVLHNKVFTGHSILPKCSWPATKSSGQPFNICFLLLSSQMYSFLSIKQFFNVWQSLGKTTQSWWLNRKTTQNTDFTHLVINNSQVKKPMINTSSNWEQIEQWRETYLHFLQLKVSHQQWKGNEKKWKELWYQQD
jgi:hypothetical protein